MKKKYKFTFLTTLNEIIEFIDGSIYFPKKPRSISGYDLGIFFYINGKIFLDNLVLVQVNEECDCGVMIRSFITRGRLMSLAEYIGILVCIIEDDFKTNLLLCPLSYRFFKIGYTFRKGMEFNMN